MRGVERGGCCTCQWLEQQRFCSILSLKTCADHLAFRKTICMEIALGWSAGFSSYKIPAPHFNLPSKGSWGESAHMDCRSAKSRALNEPV